MLLHLLALLSCQPFSEAKTPPIPEKPPEPDVVATPSVRMPGGQVIVRECYASSREEARHGGRSYPTTGAMPPPAPTTPSSSTPSMAKKQSAPAGPSGGASQGGVAGGATRSTSAPTASTSGYADAPVAAAPMATPSAKSAPTDSMGGSSDPIGSTGTIGARGNAGLGSAGAGGAGKDDARNRVGESSAAAEPFVADEAQGQQPMGDAKTESTPRRAPEKEAKDKGGYDRDEMSSREQPYVDPNLDWGATVYLSNDDSMSLASAQRLLWAIQNKGPVSASQVRPHELLNYFSFDTNPVAEGDLFSVKGSAEQTAPDVLTLAFAVKGVTPARKPLDLTMVLDRSGSMTAEGRMEYLKRGLTKMSDQLVRGDRVDLVLFDDQVCTPLENYVVGRDDPSLLTDAIARLAPRGSTDLDAGLKEGYRIANARTGEDVSGRNRRMMLISDALLNTGDVNPNTVSEVAKAYEESGVRLTAVGVGRDFNDKILDMLTEKGKGAYVYLGSEAVVDRVFGIGFESLVQTIAHDVRFSLDLPPSLAMKKFYGEESSTNPEDVQPINYYAGTTQLFLQDLQLKDGRAVASDPLTLTVEFSDAATGRPSTQVFHTTVGALLQSDPRNMRKARALMSWTDLILAKALGGSPCGAPFTTWQERVDRLGDDAEISWLDGLTSPLCGATPVVPRPVARGVPYKVKVDSDLPIAEVTLTCSGTHQTESLSGSDTVARFANATPGGCTLTLQGNVPMQAQVDVPATGGDIRCLVRGGRLSCG
jgi:Ca-activated chloride channel family protein